MRASIADVVRQAQLDLVQGGKLHVTHQRYAISKVGNVCAVVVESRPDGILTRVYDVSGSRQRRLSTAELEREL